MTNNAIIQFLDCYVVNGDIRPGTSPWFPRFYIDRKVYETVKSGKIQTHCSEINDLIAHLRDYDESAIKSFKSRFSTFLMNTPSLKSRFKTKTNILYGWSGANGKTLFIECLRRAVGEKNVSVSTDLKGLCRSSYECALMCDSLIAVDDNIAFVPISNKLYELIKLFIVGQDIVAHRNTLFEPCAMLIGCTNNMLWTSDKSKDINDITCTFSQNRRLPASEGSRDLRWFENVKSDEAAQYLLELLVLAHIENMEADHLF